MSYPVRPCFPSEVRKGPHRITDKAAIAFQMQEDAGRDRYRNSKDPIDLNAVDGKHFERLWHILETRKKV